MGLYCIRGVSLLETEAILLPLERKLLDKSVDLFIDTFSREPWNDVYESREQVVRFFERYMSNNYFLGYVLKLGDEIVALSIGAQKPWFEGMEYYIDQFCVGAGVQGRGLGRRFLQLIEADAKSKGVNAITLTTNKGFVSEKFYLKNGFKVLDDTIYLAKLLKTT